VSARFRFSPLFVELCVCYYLGALSGPRHIKTMHLMVCAALVGVRHGFLLDVVLCKWIMPYSPLLPVFLLC
jgi:hypothetical protein